VVRLRYAWCVLRGWHRWAHDCDCCRDCRATGVRLAAGRHFVSAPPEDRVGKQTVEGP
jgi:hypothetical protein